MWPSFVVKVFKHIVARIAEYFANSDVHQILLFFFTKDLLAAPEFLYTDEEKDAVQIFRLFSDQGFYFLKKRVPLSVKVEVALKHSEVPPNTRTRDADVE